jgi:site-specific DNA-methyltransferase (adenine-specific)
MKPYYQDDAVTIYHGDCREIRAWLLADVLITDPPYGVGGALSMSGFASERRFGVQKWDDLDLRDEVLELWGDRPAAIFGSPRRLDRAPSYREVPLVWDKGDMVAMGDTSFPWRATYELIYISGRPWQGFRDPAVLRWPHNSSAASSVGHPSTKPIPLMQALISKSAGVIADPFMGSGSTLRAAKSLGRKAIGIEIEERYCEIAAGRCSQEVLGLTA